jgi:ABC-type amino acid transport substrate-binding protein
MRNLKVPVVVDAVPPARANMLVLSGAVAGEVARIDSYGQKNPMLIRVEPSLYYLTSVAFARKDRAIKLFGVADLAHYQVVHIRGVQHSTDIVKELPQLRELNNSESMFSLLMAARVDVAITTGLDGRMMLKKMQMGDEIEAVAELARRDLFVYLNPNYEKWKKPISDELARMKATGEMAKIITEREQLLADAAMATAPAAN